jgi:hypothetical protein
VGADVVVVEPDDHRRLVAGADEVRAERDDRAGVLEGQGHELAQTVRSFLTGAGLLRGN